MAASGKIKANFGLSRVSSARSPTPRASEFNRVGLPWPVGIYLTCLILPILFDAGPIFLTTLRVFLILLVVPLWIRLFSGEFGGVFFTDILLMLHVIWACFALMINSPGQAVEQVGAISIELLGGYVMGRAYIRSVDSFIALSKSLVLIMTFALPFTIAEALTDRPVLLELLDGLPGVFSLPNVKMDPRMGLDRVQFTFAHPIHFGLFCSVAFGLGLVALQGVRAWPWRWLGALLICVNGFLSLSSGALLAIIIQMLLIIWYSLTVKVAGRWWILVALGLLAYLVVDMLSNRSPYAVFLSYATFNAQTAFYRDLIYEWGMRNVWSNPLFGLGLRDWMRPSWMISGSVDNFWLLTTMKFGIPGFVFLGLGWFYGLGRVMLLQLEESPALSNIRRAWVFVFIGLSFTLTTVHVWHNLFSFVMFLLGAGLWLLSAGSTATHPLQRASGITSADARSKIGSSAHPINRSRFGRPVGFEHSRFPVRRARGD